MESARKYLKCFCLSIVEEQERLLASFQFSNSVTFKGPFRQEKRFGPFQVGLFHGDQPQRCPKCDRRGHFARERPNLIFTSLQDF